MKITRVGVELAKHEFQAQYRLLGAQTGAMQGNFGVRGRYLPKTAPVDPLPGTQSYGSMVTFGT